jgi:hypothetical protein
MRLAGSTVSKGVGLGMDHKVPPVIAVQRFVRC